MESDEEVRQHKLNELAAIIFRSASSIYRQVEGNLENHKIEMSNIIEFAAELACYVLHLFDRSLAGVTEKDCKNALMDKLCLAACRAQHGLLREIGLDVSEEEVEQIFGTMYTTRQLEYGDFNDDWYAQVSLRFGRNGCEALNIPFEKTGYSTIQFATLAPEVFKGLLPIVLELAND